MQLKEQIAVRFLSGKWLLTVTGGFCLTIITLVDCCMALKGMTPFVDPSTLLTIGTGIVMSYFGRPVDASQQPNPSADIASRR